MRKILKELNMLDDNAEEKRKNIPYLLKLYKLLTKFSRKTTKYLFKYFWFIFVPYILLMICSEIFNTWYIYFLFVSNLIFIFTLIIPAFLMFISEFIILILKPLLRLEKTKKFLKELIITLLKFLKELIIILLKIIGIIAIIVIIYWLWTWASEKISEHSNVIIILLLILILARLYKN